MCQWDIRSQALPLGRGPWGTGESRLSPPLPGLPDPAMGAVHRLDVGGPRPSSGLGRTAQAVPPRVPVLGTGLRYSRPASEMRRATVKELTEGHTKSGACGLMAGPQESCQEGREPKGPPLEPPGSSGSFPFLPGVASRSLHKGLSGERRDNLVRGTPSGPIPWRAGGERSPHGRRNARKGVGWSQPALLVELP